MADTRRALDDFLNASTGLLKDNSAGDISAQDLRDVVLTLFGAMFPKSTLETADFTAVAGTSHGIDLDNGGAGLSDNIEVTFPATPTRGDRFRMFVARANVTDGGASPFAQAPFYCVEPATATEVNNVSYTANGAGGGAKWSLWLVGEYLEFEYVDSTIGWIVVDDGRIPHHCMAYPTTERDHADGVDTQIVLDEATDDNAGLFANSSDDIQIKRGSRYLVEAYVGFSDLIVDGSNCLIRSKDSGGSLHTNVILTWVGTATATTRMAAPPRVRTISAGESADLWATVDFNSSSPGDMSLATGTGGCFVSVTEQKD